jgi:parallel beta-helix repeat protein
MEMKRMPLVLLGMAVMLSIAFTPSVSGNGPTTRIVDDDDAGHQWSGYTVIQDAVNASIFGDIILVYNGTYNEDVIVDVGITITGNGSDDTHVVGSGTDNVFDLDYNGITLSGFNVSNSGSGDYGGITVNSNSDVAISEVDATGCVYGILGFYADDLSVNFSHLYGNDFGLWYENSDGGMFNENNISYNQGHGIGMRDCNWTNMSGNQIHQNNADDLYYSGGIYMDLSENCSVIENTIINNRQHGVMAYRSYFIVLGANQIYKNCGGDAGILLEVSSDCRVVDNNLSDNTGQGVELYEGCKRCIIEGNTIIGNLRYGVRVGEMSNDTLVIGNVIEGNQDHAVRAFDAENLTIKWNNITENDGASKYAVHIWYSGYINIIENNITGNTFGIDIEQTDVVFIVGNNISDQPDSPGITIDNSDDLEISNNTISWNENGISVNHCLLIRIVYNEIFNNSAEGVYFGSTVVNGSVHHNNFLGNDWSGIGNQAWDDGDNWWDDEVEGNWWYDWNGTGNYTIGGSGGSADEYPQGDPVPTSAPERVPEFGLLYSVSAILGLALIIRRQR